MAGVDVQHNRGWSQHRRANHRNRHKPCDVRWLGILERALEDMVIGLHTLHHLAEEAGYALTPEGRWTEIEKVQKAEGYERGKQTNTAAGAADFSSPVENSDPATAPGLSRREVQES